VTTFLKGLAFAAVSGGALHPSLEKHVLNDSKKN